MRLFRWFSNTVSTPLTFPFLELSYSLLQQPLSFQTPWLLSLLLLFKINGFNHHNGFCLALLNLKITKKKFYFNFCAKNCKLFQKENKIYLIHLMVAWRYQLFKVKNVHFLTTIIKNQHISSQKDAKCQQNCKENCKKTVKLWKIVREASAKPQFSRSPKFRGQLCKEGASKWYILHLELQVKDRSLTFIFTS